MSRYNTVTKAGGYNINTGGYGNLTANQLKNITLPEKLRCKRCMKWKKSDIDGKENFSKKQLAGLREAIYYSGSGKQTTTDVVCNNCSPGQNNELHCAYCDITKGLESFSLAQRKNPIAATCLVCMSEQLDFDPDAGADELNGICGSAEGRYDADYDYDSDDSEERYIYSCTSDGDDDTSDVADSSTYDDDTTESGYEGSGVTGSPQISASIDSLNISASSGGVHLSQRRSEISDWQTATGGRARKAASPSTAVNGSYSSSSANVQFNKTGFAKVKAYIPPPPESYAADPEQAKKAGAAKLLVNLKNDSKCTDSAWDSEEEEGSIATTRATCATRATQEDLENLQEHEITWDSDSSSDDGLDYDSDE